jgi:hypothetical protein
LPEILAFIALAASLSTPPAQPAAPGSFAADAAQAGEVPARPIPDPLGDPPASAPVSSLPAGALPAAANPSTPHEPAPRWEWLGNPIAPKSRGATSPRRRTPHRFLPLPSLRAQPAVGLMLGASLNYAYRRRDDEPNQVYAFVEARVSLRRVQQHGFLVRLRDLLGRREIFEFGTVGIIDPVFPYFGVANNQNLHGQDLLGRFYQTKLSTVGGSFSFQHPLWTYKPLGPGPVGTLRSYSGVGFYFDRITPYANSLFALERSTDAGSTRRGMLRLGLTWDRRDNEWSPRTGAFHDVTVETAGPWTGSTDAWGRVQASLRHYWQLGVPSLVFAHRLSYDALWGDAPFVPLGEFGGLATSDGLGGTSTGRGWLRRRYIGKQKAFASVELRFEPVEFKLGKHRLGLGIKGYVDLGMVAQQLGDLPLHLHVSGGPGMLIVWDRFAVIRLDGGFSRETRGFYLMTEHAF